jgi:hypothetical protein
MDEMREVEMHDEPVESGAREEEGDAAEGVPRRVPEPGEPADPGVPGRDDPEPVGPGA